MGEPFAFFHELGFDGEGHEVAAGDEAGVVVAEEEGSFVGGDLVGLVGRVVVGHAC